MNKKLLTLLVGIVLAAVLLSCSLTDMFKKKEEPPPQPPQEEQVEPPQPPVEETEPPPPPPQEEPVTPPPSKPKTKPAEPVKSEEPAEPVEEEKIPKAGLGVIFITNVRTGAFRVKIDDQKPPAIDHSFAGKKGGKADELRFERELKFEPGAHKFRFVCEDNEGSKGVKELDMNFAPGQHKVVRVVVKGAPGDIKLEILE
ncbi:MAG TPA: hypothetical protein PK747_08905 [Acidobacteriota bacterium]|nr:hypothetical protein [Acidobacteriota bacterium]HNT18270.1 hypothetical protein [Acidobacteriota bacterium]HPA27345.1 hypothetical protein [Acidobacteriota bacterium]HQO20185.1 hypothetical protein [Acidobacteriota bacterium]HQQ47513.1 hypothetical protein [Acidobacteriota bacterium]